MKIWYQDKWIDMSQVWNPHTQKDSAESRTSGKTSDGGARRYKNPPDDKIRWICCLQYRFTMLKNEPLPLQESSSLVYAIGSSVKSPS